MNNEFTFINTILDEGHMDGDQMMGGWFGGSMWFWTIAIWVVFIGIAFLVYRDAENRGKNGLLWFVLVILPWVGILFLVIYLIVREEKGINDYKHKSSDIILDDRYARGEITQKEYYRMKEDIKRAVGR